MAALRALHEGFPVPARGAFVPWLVTLPELFARIPAEEFSFSSLDWPLLRFTLLGFTGTFGFNFVSHPERRLVAVQFENEDAATRTATFDRAAACLPRHLGEPDDGNPWQQRWYDGRLRVFNRIATGYAVREGRERTVHTLCIYAAFGTPRTA